MHEKRRSVTMPPAARSLDLHLCSMHPIPYTPTSGLIQPRTDRPTVNIGFQPAAREGDVVRWSMGGKEGTVLKGEPTVRIEGKPAARLGDPISHQKDQITGVGIPCGNIQLACPTVWIGSLAQASTLRRAAQEGTPFCECEDASG